MSIWTKLFGNRRVQNPMRQPGELAYVMILKSPPDPQNKKMYVSQVLKAVCPELTPGITVNMEVTSEYSNEAHIAVAAKFGAARNGITVDMDKVRIQEFGDADSGRGTLIKCYR